MPDITTITGLSGRIRIFRPGDWHKVSSDKSMQNKVTPLWEEELVKGIWQETLSVGPYAFTGNPPWSGDVLVGDKQDALLRCRMATSGTKHLIENVECGGRRCNERFDAEIDMGTDLRRQVLTEQIRDELLELYGETTTDDLDTPIFVVPHATYEAISGDGIVHSELSDGTPVAWRLQSGKTQREMLKYYKAHGVSEITNIAARLVTLGEIKPRHFFKHLTEEMDEDQFTELWTMVEEHEPGLETEVELACPDCLEVNRVDFGLANFLLPNWTRSRRRRTSTSAKPIPASALNTS